MRFAFVTLAEVVPDGSDDRSNWTSAELPLPTFRNGSVP
jgi:hypothetical protein